MSDRRRSFGPVMLLGLGSATLAAVAANQPWVTGTAGNIDTGASEAMASTLRLDAVQESPLASALALVALACWGVLLVTRGHFRRAVAVLAAVAAIALLATTALAFDGLQDSLGEALREAAATDASSVAVTGWWWAALVAAALGVLAAVAAVVLVRAWPEMGTRYDAPAAASGPQSAAPEDNLDIWKALDEGRDPTA